MNASGTINVKTEEDPETQVLTRQIVTTRRVAGGERTDEEVHQLKLYPQPAR